MSAPMVQQTVDTVSFALAQPHDFSWLHDIGTVFCVFDQQDSGNLCFGVETPFGRVFVKYAGAPTIAYCGSVEAAVDRLVRAVPLYCDLQHDILVPLQRHFRAGDGYAAVFGWVDGENLHPYWLYPPPAKYTHPLSPFHRFKQLPIAKRLQAFGAIVRFHEHVEQLGYVAVDFYDGSLMYDFSTHALTVVDIDFYQKRPYRNTMGRLWGSSRFMSPEEFQLGAPIDERTNVYCMGATAFCLLGGERNRSIDAWEANEALFAVASRAASADRALRYSTVKNFKAAWLDALGQVETGERGADIR